MHKKTPLIIILAVIATSLYFGLPRLKSFSGIDEPLWSYERVPKFWKSIEKGNLKGTTLCDKPGITLAAISGIGLPFVENPKKLEKLRYEPKNSNQSQEISNLYLYLRLPVFLFTLLMLPVFYFLIKRLLGRKTALLSVIFIGLSPVLLGISLMINTDAILWNMLPLTILSFLVYQKENNKKFLYLSGFLLGLTLIDKYIGNILLPFFFGLIFLRYIVDDEVQKNKDYFKRAFTDYGILLMIAVATIFIFYPAAWIKPKTILDVTIFSKAFYKTWYFFFAIVLFGAIDTFFLKSVLLQNVCDFFNSHKKWLLGAVFAISIALILFVLINVYSGMKFFDFQPIFQSPTKELNSINSHFTEPGAIMLSSFYPLIFGLTPIVTTLFIYSIFVSILPKSNIKKTVYVFYLLLFTLFYYLGSVASGVSPTVRYQIVLFPLASIIAAIGFVHLISSNKLKKYFSITIFNLTLILIIITSIFSLKSIQPFFLSYSSDLLPKKYVLNLRDMGDGSWEAAQYLNNLTDAKNIRVWSDKGGVCEAFVGKCSDSLKKSKLNENFDYIVITAGREAKSISSGRIKKAKINDMKIPEIYSETVTYVFRLNIDGRSGNYVKIIKASDLTQKSL